MTLVYTATLLGCSKLPSTYTSICLRCICPPRQICPSTQLIYVHHRSSSPSPLLVMYLDSICFRTISISIGSPLSYLGLLSLSAEYVHSREGYTYKGSSRPARCISSMYRQVQGHRPTYWFGNALAYYSDSFALPQRQVGSCGDLTARRRSVCVWLLGASDGTWGEQSKPKPRHAHVATSQRGVHVRIR